MHGNMNVNFPTFVLNVSYLCIQNGRSTMVEWKTLHNYGKKFIMTKPTWSMLNCRQNRRIRFGRPLKRLLDKARLVTDDDYDEDDDDDDVHNTV